ncbi:hypothetical protein BC938DRAFT_481102 [Jimgerdemannia flammicorona]|uniref:Uncharacterized protein n=1 Tax=Jimgerdemannia flammicorona TaxID=994334 RepID=A0A433QGY9_9FUNG|nr:hypothetical protein BC938DRAFT_481102 [Jimgerdemannia flammicorona]
MTKLTALIIVFIALSSYTTPTSAHLRIRDPPTRRSPESSYYNQHKCISNNLASPVGFQGKFPYPCRGFARGPALKTWTAGQQIKVEIDPNANHHGGHCELAISYDEKNFAVIYQAFDRCLANCVTGNRAGCTITATLPASLPASKNAILAWSWIAREGNREYFHGCSDIEIKTTKKAKRAAKKGYTGKKMLVANYPGYPTIFEFNNTYNGAELYKRQPSITIAPSKNEKAAKITASAGGCPLPAFDMGDVSKLPKKLPVPNTPCKGNEPARCLHPEDPGLNGLLFIACDGTSWQQGSLSGGLKCVETEKGMMGYSLSAGDLKDDNNYN